MVNRKHSGAIRRTFSPTIRRWRLTLALKTAIAVGLAWPIAQLLPGAVDDYSYYAPLGALISMTPTLMGSLRASLQTALGLAVGIGLAWLVLVSPLPGTVSVPLAVGIGVLLGGIRGLGAGRDYVAIAALFVLVVGGTQAEDYSVGYLVQMAVGMAIGIVVNLVIAPPLRLGESARQIEELRTEIADHLDGMASALRESWPPEHQDWFEGAQSLGASIRAAEPVVEDARESRRLNPRARWHEYDLQEDYDDLTAISRLSHDVRDLGETIGGAIWADPVPVGLPDALREPLSVALASTAELVRAWNAKENKAEALDAAERALRDLHEVGRQLPASESPDGALGAIMFSLRRTIAAIRDRLDLPTA
ncbi:MAG TPA: FUSC family protein [Homoserinimonas sp.]|nr:FUSC family protein [Homoserinimonas sp.]